jgi:hypothetical protein
MAGIFKRVKLHGVVVMLCVLALTSTCVVFSTPTLGKYVGTASGMAVASIAKWDVKQSFTGPGANQTPSKLLFSDGALNNTDLNRLQRFTAQRTSDATAGAVYAITLTNDSQVAAYGWLYNTLDSNGVIPSAIGAAFAVTGRNNATDAPIVGNQISATPRWSFAPGGSVTFTINFYDASKFSQITGAMASPASVTYNANFEVRWEQID